MALTKAEMAEHLFETLGMNKRVAKEMVESNFDLRDKNQRPGRNPKTGEDIPISARRVVTFRPGQKLKTHVEASNTGK